MATQIETMTADHWSNVPPALQKIILEAITNGRVEIRLDVEYPDRIYPHSSVVRDPPPDAEVTIRTRITLPDNPQV